MSGKLKIVLASLLISSAEAHAALENRLTEAAACADAREQIFDAYYEAYGEGKSSGAQLSFAGGNPSLERALGSIHLLLTSEVRNFARAGEQTGESDPILHLIRLEMRSQIEPEYDRINRELDGALAKAKDSAKASFVPCLGSAKSVALADLQAFGPHTGEIAYGARRTMATAYQSCRVLDLPPVTNDVEDVDGAIRAKKMDKVGWGRAYTDLAALKRTHYYHRVTTFAGNCLNQDEQPLVYDYGGEPGIDHRNGTLNLFVDVGGGPALGIDCSAFTATSALSSGSRYQASTTNRPEFTHFVSRDYISAKNSHWNCFEQVKVNADSTIKPGDIGAYNGHVVMVDSVGKDPFGLANIADPEQCSSLSARDFDFVIIQSSSDKEHLGINRYLARDLFARGGHMSELFMRHARQACLSKFDQVERTPSTATLGLIRHRQTASCLAPRIKLHHEDCVASCVSL